LKYYFNLWRTVRVRSRDLSVEDWTHTPD